MYIRDRELVTPHLVLKSIEDKDKKDFIPIFTSEEVKETYMLPDLKTKEEKEALFNRLKTISEDREKFTYGIYLDERIIGYINEVDKKGDTIEMGYFLSPNFWGKGYATEALEACIKELFKIGYNHVKCGYFTGNNASKRVMEKCGLSKTDEVEEIEYNGNKLLAIYYQIDNPVLFK